MVKSTMFMALLLTTLAAFAHGRACPLPQTTDPTPDTKLVPTNTSVTYYQGSAGNEGPHCMVNVGSDVLESNYCTPIKVNAFGISQVPEHNCTFTLFSGSTSCDTNAPASTVEVDKTVFVIEAGNATVCVEMGVLDGGKFQKASGIWSCG